MWNGWSHTQAWRIKIWRDILATEVPTEKQVPAPYPSLQPRVPVPGRKVSINSGCKNQWKLWLSETGGFWRPREFLLKGLHTVLLRFTPSELQHWGSSSKSTRDIQEGTELSGIRAIKVLAEAIVLFLRLPSPQGQQVECRIRDSINQTHSAHPVLVIP